MQKKLGLYINKLITEFDKIPTKRKQLLTDMINFIKTKRENKSDAKLIFICTHNSRRSQFAQIWTQTAAHYYQVDNIKSFSGGSEGDGGNTRTFERTS